MVGVRHQSLEQFAYPGGTSCLRSILSTEQTADETYRIRINHQCSRSAMQAERGAGSIRTNARKLLQFSNAAREPTTTLADRVCKSN